MTASGVASLAGSEPWAIAGTGGGRAAAEALRDAVRRDRLAHAWVLVGPEGLGQQELAVALAATLNCEQPDPATRPCASCGTCARTLRDVHPALVTLEPDGAAHRVEDVRGPWTEAALRTTPEARRKVLRIVEQKSADAPSDGETLVVACRKRRSEYRVAVVTAEEAVADGVQERLQALLWSGGEA